MKPAVRDVPVLIAGGGPVGMTLAAVLAAFGVRAMLVERNATTTTHPKMDITNGRSMELFRRFGLDRALRDVAVPEDHHFDVSWITSLAGHELHRFAYPAPRAFRAAALTRNDGTGSMEPPMRVSQVEIEPVLKRFAEARSEIEVRFGTAFESLDADAATVTAVVRGPDGPEWVRCRYLVGCDGGNSRVREALGIRLEGTPRVGQLYMIHFRSDARDLLQRWGAAWHYQAPAGTMIAQNDRDIWTVHAPLQPGADPGAADPHALLAQFAGREFGYEILVANPWTPHLLLAESYGRGRVLLAGDAAHQYIPTGGYGMNTGIGDAVDLGWKLAATLHGFGGPGLLASYEAERRPVGARNRDASGRHMAVRMEIAAAYRPGLEAFGAAERRAETAAAIAALGNAENESYGIELGYCYAGSPIVVHEPGVAAPDDPVTYTPTTVPGVRLPGTFLPDGTPLYDRLGPWFTLLCFGGEDDAGFSAAARRLGVPLAVVPLPGHKPPVYGTGAILVRPDHHVAWRSGPQAGAVRAEKVLATALGWAA